MKIVNNSWYNSKDEIRNRSHKTKGTRTQATVLQAQSLHKKRKQAKPAALTRLDSAHQVYSISHALTSLGSAPPTYTISHAHADNYSRPKRHEVRCAALLLPKPETTPLTKLKEKWTRGRGLLYDMRHSVVLHFWHFTVSTVEIPWLQELTRCSLTAFW